MDYFLRNVDPDVGFQDIRDAMAEKSREFAEHGNRVYLPLTGSTT